MGDCQPILPTPTKAATACAASSRTTANERWRLQQPPLLDAAGDHRRRDREALGAGPLGEAAHDLVGAGLAVARDRADQRDQLVLRAVHRRHLVGHGAQHAPGRERDDQRLSLGEIGGQVLGRGDRDAGARVLAASSRRAAPSSRRGRSASRSSSPSAMHSAIGWSSRNLISFSLTASDTSRCTAWRETLSLCGDLVLPCCRRRSRATPRGRRDRACGPACATASPPSDCTARLLASFAQTIDNCQAAADRV